MRTACVTLILLFCGAAVSTAQESPGTNAATTSEPQTIPQPALLPTPSIFTRGLNLASRVNGEYRGAPKDGFYPEFGNMVTGEGWISVGPGYRRHVFAGHAFVDASTARDSSVFAGTRRRPSTSSRSGARRG